MSSHRCGVHIEDSVVELFLFLLFLVFVGVAVGVVINLFRRRVYRDKTDESNVGASAGYYGFFAGGGHDEIDHTGDPGNTGGWSDGGGWGDGGGFGGGDGGGGS